MPVRSALFFPATLAVLMTCPMAESATVSFNTGSLGSAANGTNADLVTQGTGAITAGGDLAAFYNAGGAITTVPFLSALNPAASSPFTIEFWANPSGFDNDDSPLSNRVSSGNRSGWVFFQRDAATGWNFRMYNGVSNGVGWDLTGGTSTLNLWNHVVATWNGNAALLYVNGQLADSSNDGGTGVYNPNTAAGTNLILGATDSGSPYNGGVDEVAFYSLALSPAQILNHFNTAASPTAGVYQNLIRTDGAQLQLSNNIPEPATTPLFAFAGIALGCRRSRKR